MRLMGLDIGDKKIGVALSDPGGTMAFPHSVMANDDNIAANLKSIIGEKDIKKIIVGIPLNLKGDLGHQGKKVDDFINNHLEPLGLPIIKYDERFTTKICAREMGGSPKDIDKYSACIILKDYILQNEK